MLWFGWIVYKYFDQQYIRNPFILHFLMFLWVVVFHSIFTPLCVRVCVYVCRSCMHIRYATNRISFRFNGFHGESRYLHSNQLLLRSFVIGAEQRETMTTANPKKNGYNWYRRYSLCLIWGARVCTVNQMSVAHNGHGTYIRLTYTWLSHLSNRKQIHRHTYHKSNYVKWEKSIACG